MPESQVLAIGFGAQAFVKDLLVGISVLAEDQYGVGDVIDFGEGSGTVESMTLKSTRVRSLGWDFVAPSQRGDSKSCKQDSRLVTSDSDIGVAYSSEITLYKKKSRKC